MKKDFEVERYEFFNLFLSPRLRVPVSPCRFLSVMMTDSVLS